MDRSVLISLFVYSLIGLTFVIVGQTFILASANEKSERVGRESPSPNDNLSKPGAQQNPSVENSAKQTQPDAAECYMRYGETGCLNFPLQPNRPCNSEFVYHGVHGVTECRGQ